MFFRVAIHVITVYSTFMTNQKTELSIIVHDWAVKVGYGTAMKRLLDRGVSMNTAHRLCVGTYSKTPRAILLKLLSEELEKDGFKLAA